MKVYIVRHPSRDLTPVSTKVLIKLEDSLDIGIFCNSSQKLNNKIHNSLDSFTSSAFNLVTLYDLISNYEYSSPFLVITNVTYKSLITFKKERNKWKNQ